MTGVSPILGTPHTYILEKTAFCLTAAAKLKWGFHQPYIEKNLEALAMAMEEIQFQMR